MRRAFQFIKITSFLKFFEFRRQRFLLHLTDCVQYDTVWTEWTHCVCVCVPDTDLLDDQPLWKPNIRWRRISGCSISYIEIIHVFTFLLHTYFLKYKKCEVISDFSSPGWKDLIAYSAGDPMQIYPESGMISRGHIRNPAGYPAVVSGIRSGYPI